MVSPVMVMGRFDSLFYILYDKKGILWSGIGIIKYWVFRALKKQFIIYSGRNECKWIYKYMVIYACSVSFVSEFRIVNYVYAWGYLLSIYIVISILFIIFFIPNIPKIRNFKYAKMSYILNGLGYKRR